jgi:large subunit ribosomal protein L23
MSRSAEQERLSQVLIGPHVSEKSTNAAESSGQVVFKVRPDANKKDIRRAVELLFEVKVQSVTVARVRGKAKRFGRTLGRRSDWKKAYVRLAPGNDIDFVGAD